MFWSAFNVVVINRPAAPTRRRRNVSYLAGGREPNRSSPRLPAEESTFPSQKDSPRVKSVMEEARIAPDAVGGFHSETSISITQETRRAINHAGLNGGLRGSLSSRCNPVKFAALSASSCIVGRVRGFGPRFGVSFLWLPDVCSGLCHTDVLGSLSP